MVLKRNLNLEIENSLLPSTNSFYDIYIDQTILNLEQNVLQSFLENSFKSNYLILKYLFQIL